jgi:hypothetical protein
MNIDENIQSLLTFVQNLLVFHSVDEEILHQTDSVPVNAISLRNQMDGVARCWTAAHGEVSTVKWCFAWMKGM